MFEFLYSVGYVISFKTCAVFASPHRKSVELFSGLKVLLFWATGCSGPGF